MTRRSLAYLGTPEMAVPTLRSLVEHGHDIVLVVTRPDRRRGRGSELSPSPVKRAALELGLRVTHELHDVAEAGAELGIVVAYGQLIPASLLEPPAGLPMLNIHFSLLPRWRGAAPVERALLAGDSETGVCIMRLDAGLDTGPVLASSAVSIGPTDTAAVLRQRLVERGTALLLDALDGELPAGTAQEGTPTYAAKISPAELRIDWTAPLAAIDRLVRLGSAWTTFRGRRLRVLEAVLDSAAAGGSVESPAPGLRLVRVQPEGRGPMSAADFCRGARLEPGESLE
jgi:methionyl-tRNA formyltransferase